MSFLDTVRRAKTYLEEQGRVSVRALRREFELDDDSLADLVEELVEIQGVATHDGPALAWRGPAPIAPPAPPERDARAYTPKHLADKILRSKSALEGERKQVTVLFADVKSSMELAGQLDPEQWHTILDRFFTILSEGVHRFEGTVNQYTGDGIMALFGAPIAHEDHAQRACFAALHLRDALRAFGQELRREYGLDFQTRIGLNSGEVVVGKIGDDLRMDYTAQGATVGLAQRMEQLAEAGKPYLTEATADLARGYFALEDLGEFKVKGADAALRVFGLEGVGDLRTRFDRSRARGLSRFVAREDELEQLETALTHAREEQGRVVGIVAEAGTGKSRLCFELAERCRARGIPVREAQCVSHGRLIPFHPVLQILRAYFGVEAEEDEHEARRKIAGTLLLLDRELEPALPMLFGFLGVPDPERPVPPQDVGNQRRLFGALRRVIEAEIQRQPGVILVEDLHWIDASSAAFLDQMVEAVRANRGLLLLNFRPEFHAAWMERSGYQQLALEPLGGAGVEALLADLLGSDPSVSELGPRIRESSGGNPFFIEEIVRELAETGVLTGQSGAHRLERAVRSIQIPATVEVVLAARIDRLAEREKQLLQTASIIGIQFSERELLGLGQLAESDLRDAIATLVEAGLLVERALYPEALYAFAHPLTQKVAYRSQLEVRRRTLHAAVAETLLEADAKQLDERAALISHHLGGAGEALGAARWLSRAKQLTLARSPHAGGFDEKIVDLLEGLPETEEVLELKTWALLELAARPYFAAESVADYEALTARADALAQRSKNVLHRAAPALRRGFASMTKPGWTSTEVVQAFEAARDIVAADPSQPPFPGVVGYVVAGRYPEALRDGELFLANRHRYDPGTSIAGASPEVTPYYYAQALIEAGAFERGHALLDELAARDFEYSVDGERFRILLAELTGETRGALERGQRAIANFATFDTPGTKSISYIAALEALANGHLLERSYAGCAEAAREALAIDGEYHTGMFIAPALRAQLAEAELGLGHHDAARAMADEAVECMRAHEMRGREVNALLARIRVRLATEGAGAAAAIRQDADDALALCARNGTPPWEPLIREELARLAAAEGDRAGADEAFREVARQYRALGASGHVRRLGAELGE